MYFVAAAFKWTFLSGASGPNADSGEQCERRIDYCENVRLFVAIVCWPLSCFPIRTCDVKVDCMKRLPNVLMEEQITPHTLQVDLAGKSGLVHSTN